jgi:hypothetical protein
MDGLRFLLMGLIDLTCQRLRLKPLGCLLQILIIIFLRLDVRYLKSLSTKPISTFNKVILGLLLLAVLGILFNLVDQKLSLLLGLLLPGLLGSLHELKAHDALVLRLLLGLLTLRFCVEVDLDVAIVTLASILGVIIILIIQVHEFSLDV